ncbi:flagellar motor protein MotB [Halopseudomonas sabulinigri]|uniref:Chemotaxis protein MotB n=1 Tax=Halopseudomonas sabulinigri TaxID=472181 RepID=A0A1H1QP20_9GAMM|nr:flagellar motor protein MotB [Halopseudomonas sabulinigri]SDS25155.1 chemotaxis protein MotB [Halopseudomonas sabulinigri]
MDNNQPIIVKRITRKAAGHHGGSWKIAFADFAVAMMAFFLVMWLITVATPEQLKNISGYFNDPVGFSEGGSPYPIDLGGSPQVSPNITLSEEQDPQDENLVDESAAKELADQIEQRELEMLLQELQNQIDEEPVLQRFKDQILIEITQDGLRIQIIDAENRPMFASGSAELQPYFEEILLALSDTIAKVPKKISVSGHTDAEPYRGRRGYGNWELSSDRANAARRTLLAAGYPDRQVARVVGYADSALFDREDPLSATNRRIDIVVLNHQAEAQLRESAETEPAAAEAVEQALQEAPAPPVPSPAPEPASALPAAAEPATAPGDVAPAPRSLNLFEDSSDPAGRLRQ